MICLVEDDHKGSTAAYPSTSYAIRGIRLRIVPSLGGEEQTIAIEHRFYYVGGNISIMDNSKSGVGDT